VTISVLRNRKHLNLTARVAATNYESNTLGITVSNLPAETIRKLRLRKGTPAVVVAKVAPNGQASGALAPGDIVWEFNRNPIRSIQDFAEADAGANPKGILLLIQRGGSRFYMVFRK
jgi:serine protease Do